MRTREIYDALCVHYRKPGAPRDGEILIPEVAAPGSDRRADLVRVATWRSRGLGIDVHEIKVSRTDWLRELDDPGKAEPWWPYCSRFWITAPDRVVKPEELPDGWGLMTPPTRADRRRFTTVVKPAARTPQLTVELLVTLLARADNIRLAEMDQLRAEHRADKARAAEEARRGVAINGLPASVRNRLELLDKLETDLGADLSDYTSRWSNRTQITPGDAADVLRAFTNNHLDLKDRADRVHGEEQRLVSIAKVIINSLGEDTPECRPAGQQART